MVDGRGRVTKKESDLSTVVGRDNCGTCQI